MPEATNDQVQRYCNERVRVRAEAIRAIRAALLDDLAAIDDVYARAAGTSRWNDARTDGPPHLLQCGNSANPDDVLNFNAFATLFLKFMDGTFASQGEANSAAADWTVLDRACVRAIGG